MLNINENYLENLSFADLQFLSEVYEDINWSGAIEGGREQPDLEDTDTKSELIEKAIDAKIIKLDNSLFQKNNGKLEINEETLKKTNCADLQFLSEVYEDISWSGAIEGGREQPYLEKSSTKSKLIEKAIDAKINELDNNLFQENYDKEETNTSLSKH